MPSDAQGGDAGRRAIRRELHRRGQLKKETSHGAPWFLEQRMGGRKRAERKRGERAGVRAVDVTRLKRRRATWAVVSQATRQG